MRKEGNMKIKKINTLLIGFLSFVSLFFLLTPKAFANDATVATVPIHQNIHGETILYNISSQYDDALFPDEAKNGTFSMTGDNDMSLHFSFLKPGAYQYTLKPLENENVIQSQQHMYTINILVFYNKNSQLSSTVTAENSLGYKVDPITFQEIVEDNQQSKEPTIVNHKYKTYPKTGEQKSSMSYIGMLFIALGIFIFYFWRNRNSEE